jgi:plasmid stability protein
MAKVLIRDLDERTITKLKERAARNNRSLQAELHTIVERAAVMDMGNSRAIAARIRRKLGDRHHSDSAALVSEDRQR